MRTATKKRIRMVAAILRGLRSMPIGYNDLTLWAGGLEWAANDGDIAQVLRIRGYLQDLTTEPIVPVLRGALVALVELLDSIEGDER